MISNVPSMGPPGTIHCNSGPPPTPTLPPCRLALWRRPPRAPPFSRPRRAPMPPHAASRQFSDRRGGAVRGPGGLALIPGGKHPPPGRGTPPDPRRAARSPRRKQRPNSPGLASAGPSRFPQNTALPTPAQPLLSIRPGTTPKSRPQVTAQCNTRLTPGLCPRTLHRHSAFQLGLFAYQNQRYDEPNLPVPGADPHWKLRSAAGMCRSYALRSPPKCAPQLTALPDRAQSWGNDLQAQYHTA